MYQFGMGQCVECRFVSRQTDMLIFSDSEIVANNTLIHLFQS